MARPQRTAGTSQGASAYVATLDRPVVRTTNMAGARATSPNKPLTDAQKEFVRLRASGENLKNSMINAGFAYSHSYGCRMSKMPAIANAIEKEKALFEEQNKMTRQRVMEGLLESIDMAKLMSEPSSMIAGWREIAKMCGYYEPKKVTLDINVQGNVTMQQMTKLSDAELLKLIEEGTHGDDTE